LLGSRIRFARDQSRNHVLPYLIGGAEAGLWFLVKKTLGSASIFKASDDCFSSFPLSIENLTAAELQVFHNKNRKNETELKPNYYTPQAHCRSRIKTFESHHQPLICPTQNFSYRNRGKYTSQWLQVKNRVVVVVVIVVARPSAMSSPVAMLLTAL